MKDRVELYPGMWDLVNQELSLYEIARRSGDEELKDSLPSKIKMITTPYCIALFPEYREYTIATDPFDTHAALWQEYKSEGRKKGKTPTSMVSGQVFALKDQPDKKYIRVDVGRNTSPIGTEEIVSVLVQSGYQVLTPSYQPYLPQESNK